MVKKYKAQAVLFSRRNLNCVTYLNNILNKYEFRLFYTDDFFDFISKVFYSAAEFILIDGETLNLSNFPYHLLKNKIFKERTKIILLSENFKCCNEYVCVTQLSRLDKYFEDYCNNKKKELKYINRKDYSIKINELLTKIGIGGHYFGRDYLIDCINLIINDSAKLSDLSSSAYLYIAQKNKINPSSVERDIRNAVKGSFKRRVPNIWEETFGVQFNGPPPNKYFIFLCVDKILKENP